MEHLDFRSNCEKAIESLLEQLTSSRLTAAGRAIALRTIHNCVPRTGMVVCNVHAMQRRFVAFISSIRSTVFARYNENGSSLSRLHFYRRRVHCSLCTVDYSVFLASIALHRMVPMVQLPQNGCLIFVRFVAEWRIACAQSKK